jgi:hypothetical protein
MNRRSVFSSLAALASLLVSPLRILAGANRAAAPKLSMEDWKKQYFAWLSELGRIPGRIEITENWTRGQNPSYYRLGAKLHTAMHSYSIYSHWRSDRMPYLSCGGSARYPRPGEDWTRGNDLPDGPFTEETWKNIVFGIVRYEVACADQVYDTSKKPA